MQNFEGYMGVTENAIAGDRQDQLRSSKVDSDIGKQRGRTLPGTTDAELSITIWTLLTRTTKRVSINTTSRDT